jgi:hypothetical protein
MHTFDEGANRYSNVIETTIHIPDPRNKVTIDNSRAAMDERSAIRDQTCLKGSSRLAAVVGMKSP